MGSAVAIVNGAFYYYIRGLHFQTFATQDHYNWLEKVAPAMAGVAGALPPAMMLELNHRGVDLGSFLMVGIKVLQPLK